MGSVLSVNLADVRTIERRGKPVLTGIWKLPAAGRVHARREGLAGDVQADRRVHGGPDMAVEAYAREDTRASKTTPRPRRAPAKIPARVPSCKHRGAAGLCETARDHPSTRR